MKYEDLSIIGKKVYKFYKELHLYTVKQVQDFVDKEKITKEEADFILK